MNRYTRLLLIPFLILFAYMLVAGWGTDRLLVRAVSGTMSALIVTLAIGLIAPNRFKIALRIVAGAVGIAYIAYFASEAWALLDGETQPTRTGYPSALMAGIGLLIFGVPTLLFAISGKPVGILRAVCARQAYTDVDSTFEP